MTKILKQTVFKKFFDNIKKLLKIIKYIKKNNLIIFFNVYKKAFNVSARFKIDFEIKKFFPHKKILGILRNLPFFWIFFDLDLVYIFQYSPYILNWWVF